ncbi:MAG TPA: M23 family metallopeptidase, partial [Anaerolineae bacterium]|nr:M23 family metallopeptidase [Anaerolineae bacterium]
MTTTPTPTPTLTSTPTPTPTPIAQPISASGNPRAVSLQESTSQDGPLCGLVDLFDFPLNPPEGDGVARGGGDFGMYRGRYEKYHAGEDWWMSPWRASFGSPVYSIGHGRVTYAAPNGWGRDQGVVIVRHTFADGRQVLSFYGHLERHKLPGRVQYCRPGSQNLRARGSSTSLHRRDTSHTAPDT